MTDFVVAAVQDAAQRAIGQSDVVRLSLADRACFAQALLSPPKSAPALDHAFARRSRLLRTQWAARRFSPRHSMQRTTALPLSAPLSR